VKRNRRYRGRGKRNSGKQGRRIGKKINDFLERTSIYSRFWYPLRIDNSRPS